MIVTSTEYAQWQREYGKSTQPNASDGQAFATELAVQQSITHEQVSQVPTQEENNNSPTFSEDIFEYILANRLGVDKQTLDEIKLELKALEAEQDGLKGKTTLTDAQRQRLELLNERIDVLTQLMQDLVKQASERAAQQEAQQSLLSAQTVDALGVNVPDNIKHPFGM